jgi:pSer/pThr/pTyr-binding forkhead associated (FHA) protein
MDLVGADRRIHLLPSRSVLIGRPGGERQADIGIDCRFLSRGERNLSLFSQDNRWLLEDLGSTNGSFIDGVRLKQGETTSLPVGVTQLQIGRAGAAAAPIVIEFRRPVKDPGAVVVRLRHTGSALGLAESWPTVQQDISRRWIVFRNQIGASSEEDCALRLPAPTQGIVAALRYQNGFWVVPSTGSKVSVNEVEFEAPAPLPSGASVCLGHTLFRTEAAAEQTETPA